MQASFQATNEHVSGLEAPGASKSPPPPRMSVAQDPEDLCLLAGMVSEFEPGVAAKSAANQPHVCGAAVLLPDSVSDVLLDANSLVSQVPQSYLQSAPVGDRPASQVLGDLMVARGSSLGPQEPKIPKYQDSCKTQSESFALAYKSESSRKLNSEKQKERFEELETSQLTLVRGTEDTLHKIPEYQDSCKTQSELFSLAYKSESSRKLNSENLETCVNTSQDLSFLSPCVQQDLGKHVARCWVKHRWSLPLKVLKPINVLKLKKAQSSPLPRSAFHPSATCESEAKFLEELCQAGLRKKGTREESFSTLTSHLAASSAHKTIQKAMRGAPSNNDCGPSAAPLPGQEGRWPSQPLRYSLMGRTQQSRNLGSQSSRAEETRAAVPQHRVILGSSMQASFQATNEHVRGLEAPGASKSPPPPRMCVARDPEDLCLLAGMVSEFEPGVAAKSEVYQPRVCGSPVLLPDSVSDVLLDANSLASQVPQSYLQSAPVGDRPASQVLGDLMAARGSSLGPQEPKIPKYQDSSKTQREMIALAYKSESSRKLNSEKHKERCEELGTSQFTPVRRTEDTLYGERHQPLPTKKRVPPENHFRKTLRRFLQWISPKTKGKPVLTAAQRQGTLRNRSCVDSNTAEAQGFMTAVRQMPEEKIMIRHKLHVLTINRYKGELHAPVCCQFPGYRRDC
ncbi:PREDICTED: spermatogenesis-associated protein 31A6-like [Propithecus coquereli]|uniref:spermatogenesis-associated protein 31A6-like n=1 Tax=Propithecus coquereli TaxID=379532 RepID=UPI00063F532A|nr:PREDICTED: spermatogenesis-associated protein 31A6-like [Propithecus coquereli]